jgi:hypothetical protein
MDKASPHWNTGFPLRNKVSHYILFLPYCLRQNLLYTNLLNYQLDNSEMRVENHLCMRELNNSSVSMYIRPSTHD